MPRRCTVCDHQDRDRIDAALLSGASLRDIAGRFGTSKSALERHKGDHVPTHLARAREAEEVARADDLLAQVRNLQARTLKILEAAETEQDHRTALGAISQARNNLVVLAKLLGELDERPQVGILLSAEWSGIRAVLLETLASYPDARAAVAGRLLEIESG